MEWVDGGLTIVSLICTASSVIGAKKSYEYYDKNKMFLKFGRAKVSFSEIMEIQNRMTELLELANKPHRKGVNKEFEICERGKKIRNLLVKIKEELPKEICDKINSILNEGEKSIMNYVNSLISGDVFHEGEFIIDQDFSKSDKGFEEIEQVIKEYMENLNNEYEGSDKTSIFTRLLK